ncbi:MAG: RNA 2',3'-cyclic phosphodiesterase [Nocardioidaceae bacterium]
MRMFVAVRPPEEAVEDLDAFLDVRREAGGFRWVLADQLHVTLAFLADVPDRNLDDLMERLERAARKRTPLRTRIHGGGAFPNAARARVIWTGLDLDEHGFEELRRLAVGARAAASKAGIDVDGQRFKPHLTVARLGAPRDVTPWVRLLDSYSGPEWPVQEIELIASHLGEGPNKRPRYQALAAFPLA